MSTKKKKIVHFYDAAASSEPFSRVFATQCQIADESLDSKYKCTNYLCDVTCKKCLALLIEDTAMALSSLILHE